MSSKRTAIVMGAWRGIGAALVEALLNAGYNVVATSRNVTQSLAASSNLVLVAGDIGKKDTAAKVVAAAMENFGSIELLVTNAGIFSVKPFTEFTTDDFNALVSTNPLGFVYITQLAVEQMLKQKAGAVVSITAALADQPIAGVNAAVPMITKGGLEKYSTSTVDRTPVGGSGNRGLEGSIPRSENLLDCVNRPVSVTLANTHREQAIEECVLRRGCLEPGQRAEILVRVVAHASECHVNQRPVVGFERHPEIELARSIGGRGHPVGAAQDDSAQALAFKRPARNRKDRERAMRRRTDLLGRSGRQTQAHQGTGVHRGLSFRKPA
jgi:hypothetical protein